MIEKEKSIENKPYGKLEQLLQHLKEAVLRNNVKEIRKIASDTRRMSLDSKDLNAIYSYINRDSYYFYSITRCCLEYNIENEGSEFLNIVFILSYCVQMEK